MGIMKPRESNFKVHQGLNMTDLKVASDAELKKEIKYYKAFSRRTYSSAIKTNCEQAIQDLNAELDRRLLQRPDEALKEIQLVLKGTVPKDALLSAGRIEQGVIQL